jgi:hypothetical protein
MPKEANIEKAIEETTEAFSKDSKPEKQNIQPTPDEDFDFIFDKKKELKFAKRILEKYLSANDFENPSDRALLNQLIYLEVFQAYLQENAKTYQKENGAAPLQILEAIHKNLDKIVTLKEKLNLLKKREEKEELKKDDFSVMQMLMKKFKIWRENNQGSRTLICPHCSKMVLLKIRTEAWEALNHPFFKDRILANEHLWQLYRDKKITKMDIAKVLLGKETNSTDYVDWLEKKIFSSL